MTNTISGVGHQLSGDELHQRQQKQTPNILMPTVVAVGVTDPVNIGSIFRICDAVGCKELWFVDSPIISPQKTKKVSRSISEKLPHRFITTNDFISSIPTISPIVAIEITLNSKDLFISDLPQELTFVLGGEQRGIPEDILSLCTLALHIPMFGINSSMNVATSLGIVLYEWHRRFRI